MQCGLLKKRDNFNTRLKSKEEVYRFGVVGGCGQWGCGPFEKISSFKFERSRDFF